MLRTGEKVINRLTWRTEAVSLSPDTAVVRTNIGNMGMMTSADCIDRRLLSRVRNKVAKHRDHNQGLLDPDIVKGSQQIRQLATNIAANGSHSVMFDVVRRGLARAFPGVTHADPKALGRMLEDIGGRMLQLPELEAGPRSAILLFCQYMSSTTPARLSQSGHSRH